MLAETPDGQLPVFPLDNPIDLPKRNPRVRFKHPVRVVTLDGQPRVIRTLTANVSHEGLFVRMPEPLPTGTRVALSLEAGGRALALAQAEVVWQRRQESELPGRFTGCGLRFTDFMHPRAQELVDYLVDNLDRGKPLISAPPERLGLPKWAPAVAITALALVGVIAVLFAFAPGESDELRDDATETETPTAVEAAAAPTAPVPAAAEAAPSVAVAPAPGASAESVTVRVGVAAPPSSVAPAPGSAADRAAAPAAVAPASGSAADRASAPAAVAPASGSAADRAPARAVVPTAADSASAAPPAPSAVEPAPARVGVVPARDVELTAVDTAAPTETEVAAAVPEAPVEKRVVAAPAMVLKTEPPPSAPTSSKTGQLALPSGAAKQLKWKLEGKELHLDPGVSVTKAFLLTSPARAVFDLSGNAPKSSATVSASFPHAKSVRVGKQGKNTRVVVDLDQAPTAHKQVGAALVLTF